MSTERTLSGALAELGNVRERAERLAPRIRKLVAAQQACFEAERGAAYELFCAAWPAISLVSDLYGGGPMLFGTWGPDVLYLVKGAEPCVEARRAGMLAPCVLRGEAIGAELARFSLEDVAGAIQRVLTIGEEETAEDAYVADYERDTAAVLTLRAQLAAGTVAP